MRSALSTQSESFLVISSSSHTDTEPPILTLGPKGRLKALYSKQSQQFRSSHPREQCHPGCTKNVKPNCQSNQKTQYRWKGSNFQQPAGNGKHVSSCQPTTLIQKNRLLTNLLEEKQLFSSPWNKNHYSLTLFTWDKPVRTLFYYFTDSFWWKAQRFCKSIICPSAPISIPLSSPHSHTVSAAIVEPPEEVQGDAQEHRLWSQTTWVQNLAMPLPSWVTLGKLPETFCASTWGQ